MEVQIESSRLVKPFYQGTLSFISDYTPLSVFDKISHDQHIPVIYAYCPPTPSNATIELGLRKTLAVYREFAGRFEKDDNGDPIILLNDTGVRFVEATTKSILDQTMLLKPTASLLSLHPKLNDVVELVQVQLTRFTCGSMVVGFTANHLVADGHSVSNFLVAWGQATRRLEINPLPLRDRTIFFPRNPPKFEFEHIGAEYIVKNFERVNPLINNNINDIAIHKVHYTSEFLSKLKDKASSMKGNHKPFSTFESLVAHLWRAITMARGLDGTETTHVRISVDGRDRLKPRVPNEYFGNLVLWAFPRARVDDLLRRPLCYAANVIHDAIINVNDDYFKSFVDFANFKAREEGLASNTDQNEKFLWPNLEVDSLLKFPYYDLDFGHGRPHIFMPSFFPIEGVLFIVPSFTCDGSVDAFVPLFHQNLAAFRQVCCDLDKLGSSISNHIQSNISRL